MVDPSRTEPSVAAAHGLLELVGDLGSPYINCDIAPTRIAERTWTMKDVATLWFSLSACVPTYMLASGLIASGMSAWQALLIIVLGNTIVLVPMILNGHAGTRYGIPFPVYCRTAFGIRGANIPALLRSLVACGWFGIQTWIGGAAIYQIAALYVPGWRTAPSLWLGMSRPQLLCFLLFWGISVGTVYRGIGTIRGLIRFKAPLLSALALLLLAWAWLRAGGFGPILARPSAFAPGQPRQGQFLAFFAPALTAMVSGWATLSLNISDFTRYVRSQRDHALGHTLGLPLAMGAFSFVGIAVTSASAVVYGEAVWDPVALIARFQNPAVVVVGLAGISLATLGTNIAANLVSTANDLANLWPARISFRRGGVIAGMLGMLVQPWRLVADPSGFLFTWLVGCSALCGAVGGVLICDYYLVRHRQLDLIKLYMRPGPYWYAGGYNPIALVALAAGIAPCLPGFLATLHLWKGSAGWLRLYHYAWFISFAVSFAAYALLTHATHGRSAPCPHDSQVRAHEPPHP
jgi:NCS1 family nucleobase:cation symporter-1